MKQGSGIGVVLLCVAAGLINALGAPGSPAWHVAAWLITMGLLIAFLALIGKLLGRTWCGVIIDNRNRVSLSKLQAAAWSVLVLSALITAAAINLGSAHPEAAVGIDIHQNLLIAMGIAATSVAAAPALLSLKTDERPDPDECDDAAKLSGQMKAKGRVYGRTSPTDAAWLDIFRGDEVANAASADLSKVQQFIVSTVLIVTYAVLLGDWLHDHTTIEELPDFSDGFAVLLGISHAGYLAYKAVPHGGAAAAGADGEVG